MSAKLHITGTVCSVEPIKYFDGSGSCVLKFKVVTPNVEKKKDGDEYDPSNFYTVELWNKSATAMEPQIFVSSAEKRCKVYVTGDHVIRNWESGDKKGVEELIKNANVEPYEWQKSDDNGSQGQTQTTTRTSTKAVASTTTNDDIPF